jgi:hypothetical protein
MVVLVWWAHWGAVLASRERIHDAERGGVYRNPKFPVKFQHVAWIFIAAGYRTSSPVALLPQASDPLKHFADGLLVPPELKCVFGSWFPLS